jgi:acyl carrier protein
LHNHISIIVATETRFGVKINTAEMRGLHNVGELVQCVERKVEGR